MENVLDNNRINEMLNILFHGFTEKITLLLGVPSVLLAVLTTGWVSIVAPLALAIGGCIKYYFDIKKIRAETKIKELEIEEKRLELKEMLEEFKNREDGK